MNILLYLSVLTLISVLVAAAKLIDTDRNVSELCDEPPLPEEGTSWPKVSIIVPARNEARHVETALQSLLSLDYQPLEITVVDDRSSDGTGEILDRMASVHPMLRVIHVTQLPSGWLGKNHAMHRGAEAATGEWLLFTDADVVFDPTALRRAMYYLNRNQLDHLAIAPNPRMPSWLLQSFVVLFAMYFSLFARLNRVRDPKSSAHVGVGAFNLVRAKTYRQLGGHRDVAMRPDDDLKLGKLIKKNGFRQGFLKGGPLLTVEWYSTLRETVVGLEKNVFAGVEYSVMATIVATTAICLFHVGPFLAPLVTEGATRWIYVSAAAVLFWLAWHTAAGLGSPRSCALGFPLVAAIFVFIAWRSMVLAIWNNGIRWRDTHYPLSELRKNRV